MSASTSARLSAGSVATLASRSPTPRSGLTPSSAKVAACFSKTSFRNALTQWPNRIGSETFIMVAFRCSENSTPWSLASWISLSRKVFSALTLMKVASMTSPSSSGQSAFRTVRSPPLASNSIFAVPVETAGTVTDFSLEKKSFSPIVATWVLDELDHAPMRCGFFLAYSLTALGARRSELPSRRTGFTAEPLMASYFALTVFSSSFAGSAG